MRFYGKLGKGDPCHDKRHCNPWRGSRTRENREADMAERKANGPRCGPLREEHCDGCVWDADFSRKGIRPPKLVACCYCGEILYRPGDKP